MRSGLLGPLVPTAPTQDCDRAKKKTTAACATVVLNESFNTLSQRLASQREGLKSTSLSALMRISAHRGRHFRLIVDGISA
ncbi:protein of unknown function [Thiomonas sp. Sup16B3]|nr:protein of unknown function [Thiomonas sp. Sup16B3]